MVSYLDVELVVVAAAAEVVRRGSVVIVADAAEFVVAEEGLHRFSAGRPSSAAKRIALFSFPSA
jgi:hypothetical protein